MNKCKLMNDCGFIKKHASRDTLAGQGFIRMYCEGLWLGNCARLGFLSKYGFQPNDDLMPNGKTFRVIDTEVTFE